MTEAAKWDMRTALARIAACEFECEGGPLANNAAWAWLSRALSDGPRYGMGQVVDYEVAAEVSGVRVASVLPFTVVGIHMGSSTDKLTWSYDLSNDPPSPYHYGKVTFQHVDEDALALPKAGAP